jgi:diguanylate cyclase (GGDEF)-like protein
MRLIALGAALVWSLLLARPTLLHGPHLLLMLLCAVLLFLVRSHPSASPRERPLLCSAPLVFAFVLCVGSVSAALSALAAHLVLAQFDRTRAPRSGLRFQGAQLALAALGALALTTLLGLGQAPHPWIEGETPGSLAVRMAGATVDAAAFVAILLLLTAAEAGRWSVARRRLGATLMAYSARVLPLVLLTPLGARYGLIAGLPLLLLVALGVRLNGLAGEVADLRRRLHAAETMGHAGGNETEEPTEAEASYLLKHLLEIAQEVVPADRSLVWTLDPNTGALIPAVALPDAGSFALRTVLPGEGLIGRAAVHTRPRLVPDASSDPERGQYEVASGSWLLYPIVVRGQVCALAHWLRTTQQPFTLEDVMRLDPLVHQTALALEIAALRAQVQEQAATDGLTGLWSPPRMIDLLRDEIARAARYHRALSILMLDVDSFQLFSETYGPPQGDNLLCVIANILRANLRTVDYAGRFGDEQFLVVLPETGKDDAFRLAERLRQTVEERGGVSLSGHEASHTISIGVAAYPEDALNPTDLLQRTEEALTRSKRTGKNRVIWT